MNNYQDERKKVYKNNTEMKTKKDFTRTEQKKKIFQHVYTGLDD